MEELKRAIWQAGNISCNLKYISAIVEDLEPIVPAHIEQLRYNVSRFSCLTKVDTLSLTCVLDSMDAVTDDTKTITDMYKEILQFNLEMFDALGEMGDRYG